jgi:hypothetical protein
MRTSSYTVDVLVDRTPTTFTIPKNSRIDSIVVEKRGTAAGNISVGTTTTGPTYETILLDNITEANGAGVITISLRGGAVTEVPLVGGESAEEVAQAIAAASYEGYAAALKGTVGVLFTATKSGVKTGDNTISFGSTGIVGDKPTVTREGSNAVFKQNTITVTAVPTRPGNLIIAGIPISLDPATDTTVELVAAKIAAGSYAGWTAVQGTDASAHIVYFTSTVEGDVSNVVVEDSGFTDVEGSVTVTQQGSDATVESAVLSVTAAATTSGDITVDGVTVTILNTDSVAEIAGKIAAASYTGWTAEQGTGVDEHTVTFTADTAGAQTDIAFDGGTTGATADVNITKGQAAVVETATLEITAAPPGAGNLIIAGVTVAIDPSTETDAVATAAKIAAGDYAAAGYTAVQGANVGVNDHIVTFTATVAGEKEDLTFLSGGTLATAEVAESVAYAAAVAEQVTLPAPTSGATADGFVTITLDTGVYTIPVSEDDDVATIKAAILEEVYDGWTVADVGGDIVFTADEAGALEITPDVSYGTGVTADAFSITAGAGWTVGEEIVTTTALSTEHMNLSELTVAQSVFEKDTNTIVAAGITGGAKAILHVLLERYL